MDFSPGYCLVASQNVHVEGFIPRNSAAFWCLIASTAGLLGCYSLLPILPVIIDGQQHVKIL
jgi:MFS-type transporter involved in bile tolerance (Atg22 family)